MRFLIQASSLDPVVKHLSCCVGEYMSQLLPDGTLLVWIWPSGLGARPHMRQEGASVFPYEVDTSPVDTKLLKQLTTSHPQLATALSSTASPTMRGVLQALAPLMGDAMGPE
jgi:hypothetical protein